jgi:pilus assembly protein Flp/PilA
MTELDINHSRGRHGSRPVLRFRTLARRFLKDTSGSTMIEYGLIMALVFLAIVGALRIFADRTNGMYNYISTAFNRTS